MDAERHIIQITRNVDLYKFEAVVLAAGGLVNSDMALSQIVTTAGAHGVRSIMSALVYIL